MTTTLTADTRAVPEPSVDRIAHDRPQEYLVLNESLGDAGRIREIAATLKSGSSERTLVAIGRWIQANLRYGAEPTWRNFDTVLETKTLVSCADHALVFAALARACGIPTVIVKTMDVDWIREFRTTGTCTRWMGHVFLELFLGDRWCLLDAQTPVLYEEYDPAMRILPGNRYAYDKGADPRELVLSFESERWLEQTVAYFGRFDLALLPVGEGRPLDAFYIAANSPVYQAVTQRLQALEHVHASVCSFNAEFDRFLPQAKGCHLIITCVGDTPVLPETYHSRFLPIPLSELATKMETEPHGTLWKELDDGTSIALIYGKDLAAIQEAIGRFQIP